MTYGEECLNILLTIMKRCAERNIQVPTLKVNATLIGHRRKNTVQNNFMKILK